jgi:hypothetical protein
MPNHSLTGRRGCGRLLDFSYAGYMAGEAPLPSDVQQTHDVKQDFGATGDGVTDDTTAFVSAISSMPTGSVLFIPPGRYVLTSHLVIRTRLIIKGAGSTLTTLVITRSSSQGSNPE